MFSLFAQRTLRFRSSFLNRFSVPGRKMTIGQWTSEECCKDKEAKFSEVPKGSPELQMDPQKMFQLRSEIEKFDATSLLLDIGSTFIDFSRLYQDFVATLVKEVGPYLSKRVEEFHMARNDDLEEFWENESSDTFLLKLEDHLMTNAVLREAFERKGIAVEYFVSFCRRVRKGRRESLKFANPFNREERMNSDKSFRDALLKFVDERDKDCYHIVKLLPMLKDLL